MKSLRTKPKENYNKVILSLILTSWSMGKAELSTVTVYCSGITTETAERITIMCFLLCSIDIISLVGMAMLHFFNVAAMKRWSHFLKTSCLSTQKVSVGTILVIVRAKPLALKFSDLQSSYQLHENDTVFRLLIPLVVFNGICHLAFSISSGLFLIFRAHFSYITYRTTSAATYTVPFFTLVSPCLLWFIIRKSKRTRAEKLKMLGRQIGNERDMYFKAYSKMWNQ
ncbi:hypothetical protein COOONC_02440 [Cooperia oncophora]